MELPDAQLRAVLTPRCLYSERSDERKIVQTALEEPIGSPRLCELARNKKKILLITSDHTRSVPSRLTLPLLIDEIRRYCPDAELRILVATGLHRPTTDAELRAKMGDGIVDRETILIHNAEIEEDMRFFDILPSGGELWLNKLITWAELVVSEGLIEPHFFAGFSGGRKSILPGIASKKTVLYNHNALFIRNPNARQGMLYSNPIHRDMLFAAKQAKLAFILNVLIDSEKCVIAAVAGDPQAAHKQGCAISRQLAKVDAVVSDIAITSNGGYPLDQNVYQAVKGMTAAEACVRPGGVIIMCAALGDGHGGKAFYHWFADRESAEQVACDIEDTAPENTTMDQWQAQILARVQKKATCYFVTGKENRALIESMHMIWQPDINTAFQEAMIILGDKATVTVIPDGVGVIVQKANEYYK